MDYSFIRENFDINAITKSILSIQVAPDGFSFVISPVENRQSPDYIYIRRLNAENENLSDELSGFKGFDLKEFYYIRIIVHESTFALVPDDIFDLRDMKAYLNLIQPEQIINKAFSNPIILAKAVSVFSIDESLYKLLKNKYPGADFCHSSLPFCTMALNKSVDACFIQVYEKSAEVAVVKEKKLAFYNIFEIHDINDLVYFILNVYKSVSLSPLTHPLYIAGVILKDSEGATLLKKYIKDMRFYTTDYVILPEEGDSNFPSHYFLNHREILNCEL